MGEGRLYCCSDFCVSFRGVLRVCNAIGPWLCVDLVDKRIVITDLYPRFPEAFKMVLFSSLMPRLSRKSVWPDVVLTHSCKKHVFKTGCLAKTAAGCNSAKPVIVVAANTPLDLLRRTESKLFEEP